MIHGLAEPDELAQRPLRVHGRIGDDFAEQFVADMMRTKTWPVAGAVSARGVELLIPAQGVLMELSSIW